MNDVDLTAIEVRLAKWKDDEPGNKLSDDHDVLLAEIHRLRAVVATQERSREYLQEQNMGLLAAYEDKVQTIDGLRALLATEQAKTQPVADGFESRPITLRASLWTELDETPLRRTYSAEQLIARALSTFLYRERRTVQTEQERIEEQAYEDSK